MSKSICLASATCSAQKASKSSGSSESVGIALAEKTAATRSVSLLKVASQVTTSASSPKKGIETVSPEEISIVPEDIIGVLSSYLKT